VQLPADLPALGAAGIWPLALSYDSPATVAAFAAARGSTFPLLASARSVVIRQLGMLNTAIATEHPRYGVAQPATYLLGQDGRVERVIVHTSQTVRDSWPIALHGAVELRANASGPVVRHGAAGVAIAMSLDSATYAPHQRVGVRARVLIADGAHVYGRPLPPGYTPLTLTVAAPVGTTVEAGVYPPPAPLPLPALGETLPVYTGAVELSAYVTGEGVREDVTISVTLAWQVCTETDCLVPQTVSVSLPLRYRS